MARKRAQAAAAVSRESIAEQTAAFLKAGGKVLQIPRGVSGQAALATRKQITISHKTT